jgi:alpha-L-rhamnosidase
MKHVTILLLLLLSMFFAYAQHLSSSIKTWDAKWISVPNESGQQGSCFFRKKLSLTSRPDSFWVNVTADYHYKLYVNGNFVGTGPLPGDTTRWYYDKFNLAPFLRKGENEIATEVWNIPDFRASNNYSVFTGFLLQGNSPVESIANSDNSWRCKQNDAVTVFRTETGLPVFSDFGERFDFSKYPSNWLLPDFDDINWPNAEIITVASAQKSELNKHSLSPAPIASPKTTQQRLVHLRKNEGISNIPPRYPYAKAAIWVPAHSTVKLLFDQGFVTTAYPSITLTAGKGSVVTLSYAESLFIDDPLVHGIQAHKGNRSETDNKLFVGTKDELLIDGKTDRKWTPLNFRTFRYIQMQIITRDEPLIINNFEGMLTSQLPARQAMFRSEKKDLNKISDACWKTLQACTHETFYASPYFDHQSNIAVGRIQALAALYNCNAGNYVKQYIEAQSQQQTADGLLKNALNPDSITPAFSLLWIGMLREYRQYSNDSLFVAEKMPVARKIAAYFASIIEYKGLTKPTSGWNFADQTKNWKNGVAPESNGSSAMRDLQYLLALRDMVYLEQSLKHGARANEYQRQASQLSLAIIENYWDVSHNLFADTPDKKVFSQQVNSLAVLANVIAGDSARILMQKVVKDSLLLTQSSIYFRFYQDQALVRAGLGDEYTSQLNFYTKLIKQGLTTIPQNEKEPTLADCYGWGISPAVEIYRTILGIESASPGFKTVRIEPHLGDLTNVSGQIAHPKGIISVSYLYNKRKKEWTIEVKVPEGLQGSLYWKGKVFPLTGSNSGWRLNAKGEILKYKKAKPVRQKKQEKEAPFSEKEY